MRPLWLPHGRGSRRGVRRFEFIALHAASERRATLCGDDRHEAGQAPTARHPDIVAGQRALLSLVAERSAGFRLVIVSQSEALTCRPLSCVFRVPTAPGGRTWSVNRPWNSAVEAGYGLPDGCHPRGTAVSGR
jgi:hypothetical protein